MDGIQSYPANPTTPSPLRTTSGPLTINPAAVKSPSNYLRALRRRVWLVLAMTVPIASVACIFILRLPPVYLVKAEIEIDPPDYDPMLSTLVSHDIARRDSGSQERYIPNRAARLKSRRLQELAVSDLSLAPQLSQYEDPATEVFRTLTIIPIHKNGNTFIITLEGGDAARTKKLLEVLLREFRKETKVENEDKILATQVYAKQNLGSSKRTSRISTRSSRRRSPTARVRSVRAARASSKSST